MITEEHKKKLLSTLPSNSAKTKRKDLCAQLEITPESLDEIIEQILRYRGRGTQISLSMDTSRVRHSKWSVMRSFSTLLGRVK